ncbi:MAG: PAS domain S-box protein [Candidatus Riflebacteria bacterium]|nr:PAS domain S-box protein [Candidatus Riflebacteria bacterium]
MNNIKDKRKRRPASPSAGEELLRRLEDLKKARAELEQQREELQIREQQFVVEQLQAKKALRESEERYTTLVENLHIGFFMSDMEGKLLAANHATWKMAGYNSLEEFLSVPTPLRYADPRDRIRMLNELKENGAAKNLEMQSVRKDESVYWVSISSLLLRDDDGKPQQILGFVEDISSRKEAEEALRENRLWLLESQRVSRIGSYVLDISTGFWECSPMLYEIFGIGPDFVKNIESWEKLIHSDQREFMIRYFREEVLGRKQEFNMDYPICRFSDGKKIWVQGHGELFFDSHGNPVKMSGTIQDITDRKLAEIALKASQEKYQMLVETSPDAIALNDLTGRFLMVNRQFCRMFGYSDLNEIHSLRMTSRELIYEEDFPILDQSIEPLINNGFVGNILLRAYRQDRSVFPASFSVTMHYDAQGEPERMLAVVRDMTEIQKAEQERQRLEIRIRDAQKLESLGVLAGGIAHDFNNLLLVILGNADLAMRELPALSPAKARLMEIDRIAHRAGDLCSQMLAYSGRGKFLLENMNLSEVVEEMGHMLEVAISKKAIISYHLATKLPVVRADAMQVRQIVMNLIINASESLNDQAGVISVSTGTTECDQQILNDPLWKDHLTGGVYVFLEVADSGCGMNAETMGKIFDPFFTTKFTGRGLGLAAVLGIVRSHLGYIQVQSSPDKGTIFRVAFPLAQENDTNVTTTLTREESWHGSGLVLIVDDEKDVRETCRILFECLGFEVLLAADGVQAIDIFRKNRGQIRCILLDLTMPHMDGVEAYRNLIEIDPDVRVVVTSGYSVQDLEERFPANGKVRFIKKPYSISDLTDVLKACLNE